MKKFIISFLTIFLLVNSAPAANAETAWRYWSYWQFTDGAWQMAMTGAADVKAEDGQVQGWRYITAGIEVTEEFAPRSDASFETICSGVEKTDGEARVALIVDFGDASDYSNQADADSVSEPKTACVKVAEGDPSSLLLSSAFQTREESGMVCAVQNLPSSGCGEEVELTASSEEPVTLTNENQEESNPIQSNTISILLFGALAIGLTAFILNKSKKK